MQRIIAFALVLFTFAAGCASKAERATVVWISIDGLRPDYLDRANAPLLNRLVREGASSRRLVPPTPSLTFTSHVTQATGVAPAVHGIPGNSFYDAATKQQYTFPHEAALLRAEPIWLTAKRQGVRTLVHDWPLAHAQAGPVRTDYFLEKFDPAPTDEQRLDRLLDTWRNDAGNEPLRLLMGYVKQPDVAGHRYGPDARETFAAVAETDRLLRRFVDDVVAWFEKQRRRGEQLYVVLTSDHGMASADTFVNFERLFEKRPPRSVRRVSSATFMMLHLDDVPANGREAMKDALMKDLRRWDFLRAYTRDSLPPRWNLAHPTRVGDIVVLLEPGYAFSNRLPLATFPAEKVGEGGGVHGYAPEESPGMNAFCVIWRYPDRLQKRDLGRVEAEQMHATVARLLNIKPANGASVARVFNP